MKILIRLLFWIIFIWLVFRIQTLEAEVQRLEYKLLDYCTADTQNPSHCTDWVKNELTL